MQNEEHTHAEAQNADQVIVLGHTVVEVAVPSPTDIDMMIRLRDGLQELPE